MVTQWRILSIPIKHFGIFVGFGQNILVHNAELIIPVRIQYRNIVRKLSPKWYKSRLEIWLCDIIFVFMPQNMRYYLNYITAQKNKRHVYTRI